jgi:5-methylcytosine-specific restriction endonuclease McrA
MTLSPADRGRLQKPPRQEFSAAVKREAAARSGGLCESHRIPAKYGLVSGCGSAARDFDHIQPDAEGGEPTLDNCAHICKPCHSLKTIMDKAIAAKINRQAGRKGQQARRDRAKAEGKQSRWASRKLDGRGFQPKPEGWVSPLSKEGRRR